MAPIILRRYRPLPPIIDRKLFSYFFGPKGPERYTFWRDDRADYQLRVFGGPGTGKTTLAALIVEDLRRVFPGATIASVFLEESRADADGVPEQAETFIQRFQAEVQDQTRKDAPDNPRFLLVDDIDILWATPTTYHALEAELRRVRAAGWRVATTTRVLYPLRMNADLMSWWKPQCDSKDHEGGKFLEDDIWWMCEPCLEKQEFVCGTCRSRGYGCVGVREHGAEQFIQPYATYQLETLEVVICNLGDELVAFIARELEREHGDLQLDATSPKSCPPLSPLGRSLLATGRAQDLLDQLKARAEGNVLQARLRLDHTRARTSAEEAIPATDRIPTEILDTFKAAITRVCASSQSGLGLDAIKLVASAHDHEMEWRELNSLLVARGWSSSLAPEEVVAASGGLLKTRDVEEGCIRCYHVLFGLFVQEGYDERLGLPLSMEALWGG